jgi:hypothetical protein
MKVQLWLVEEDPSAGTAFAAIERPVKLPSERRRGTGVTRSGTRLGNECAIDDLADEMLGHGQQILVGCASLRRLTHDPVNVASALRQRMPRAFGRGGDDVPAPNLRGPCQRRGQRHLDVISTWPRADRFTRTYVIPSLHLRRVAKRSTGRRVGNFCFGTSR